MRGPKAISLPVKNREPCCVQGDFCSTQRKPPGQCVYLNRKDTYCSLFDDNLEKIEGKYCRAFACLEAYNVGDDDDDSDDYSVLHVND